MQYYGALCHLGCSQKPTLSTLRANNSEYPHYHYDILQTAYSVCTWLFHISFSVIGYEKVMLKDINLKKATIRIRGFIGSKLPKT